MALYPAAVKKLIPRHNQALHASQVILHTAVSGATSLYGYFANPATTVCSHFYVREDGTVEQYVDTKFRAPANRNANATAVSIETWDGLKPDTTPWNAAQVKALKALIEWVNANHDVPIKACTSPTSPGIGYHSQFGAPSPWTPSKGKTCPGPARIPQVRTIIEAAARDLHASPTTPEEDDDLTPEDRALLTEVRDRLRNIDGIVTRSSLGTKLPSLVDGGVTTAYLDQYIQWNDQMLHHIIDLLEKKEA
jgi:hypothetical protein